MSAFMRVKIGAIVAVAPLLLAAQLQGQQPLQRQSDPAAQQQRDARGQATQQDPQRSATSTTQTRSMGSMQAGSQTQQLERYLAKCLIIKNEAEIELNQFAAQKATDAQIKQFASKMVEDHRQLVEKLKPLAGEQAGQSATRQSVGATSQTDIQRTQPGQQPSSQQAQNDPLRPQSPGGTPGAQDIPGARSTVSSQSTPAQAGRMGASAGGQTLEQLATIDRQITERVGQRLRQKLEEIPEAEFNEAYLGSQILGHIHMLSALEVIEQQASGELKQIAQQAKQTVEQHLQHAEQLEARVGENPQARVQSQVERQ